MVKDTVKNAGCALTADAIRSELITIVSNAERKDAALGYFGGIRISKRGAKRMAYLKRVLKSIE